MMTFHPVALEPSKAHNSRSTARISVTRAKYGLLVCLGSTAAPLVVNSGAEYGLDLGDGVDAGKARIIARAGGRRARRFARGGMAIMFGLIAEIDPGERRPKEYPPFEIVDGKIIEFDLPKWARGYGGQLPAPKKPVEPPKVAAAPAKPPAVPAPAPASAPAKSGRREVLKGVTIDFSRGDETISYRGKTMDISEVDARLALALLRGAPNPIGREHLLKVVFPGTSKEGGNMLLDGAAKTLATSLLAVGLKLNPVKGVGFAMGGLPS